MALATLMDTPQPYGQMALLDTPFAPLPARRVLSEKQQNDCIGHLASFGFPSQGVQKSPLALPIMPQYGSSLVQKGLKRMQERAAAGPKRQRIRNQPPTPAAAATVKSTMSVHALAASVLKAREQRGTLTAQRSIPRLAVRNSPKSKNLQRSASFGRARLSPLERSAPIRARSCGGRVVV